MKYEVPFVNYPDHYHRIWDEVIGAIGGCLKSGDLIMREDLHRFEDKLARILHVRRAVGLNSGTDALWFGLKALGVGQGDEVVVPAHTFVASLAAIHHTGATPVLCDVGMDMCMSADSMVKMFTSKTRAVMPVHLNGRCCDMELIKNAVEAHSRNIKRQVFIVEDAAQALGATFNHRPAGAMGEFGAFSFYPAKMLGCAGDAGAFVTDNDVLAQKVELLRDHMMNRAHKNILFGYGYNSRMDNIQAAILNVKLRYLTRWIKRRRKIAKMYQEGLEGLDLVLPHYELFKECFFDVYQNYVVRCKGRNDLESYLEENGVETMVSWRVPLHNQSCLGLGLYHLPNTEAISKTCLSLPMYPELTDKQVDIVIEKVRGFFE